MFITRPFGGNLEDSQGPVSGGYCREGITVSRSTVRDTMARTTVGGDYGKDGVVRTTVEG